MKSIYRSIFCLTLFRIIIAIGAQASDSASNSNSGLVTAIYKFWKEQDKHFHLGKQKDVVLFLGNTGSGKTTTALFLTGANLKSVEFEDSEQYTIVDEKSKIGNDTLKSHTLIPELMIDQKSDVAYYDCPGFMDTRSPKHDLTISYFLNKLLTFADSFKLIFVVNHSDLKVGEDRHDFLSLVRNAVMLIKDIEKYSDGIALVVTKVESPKTDVKIIKQIAAFLKQIKRSLSADNNKPNIPEETRKLNSDSIKFIDALLNQEGESYSRIGIFRRPQEAGQLDQMDVFLAERTQLYTMINQNIKYVRKESDDFGFIISPESKTYVVELTEKITKDEFVSDVANICQEIEEVYSQKEDLITDVSNLQKNTKLGADLFSAIRTEDPRLFIKDIVNVTYVLDIGVSIDTLAPIVRHLEYVDYLMRVVDQKLTNPMELANQLNQVVVHLRKSQKWYAFLIDLGKALTKSNLQNDDMKRVATELERSLVIGTNEQKAIQHTELKRLLEKVDSILYSDVETLVFNSVQLKALKNILHEYSTDHLIVTCSANQLDMTAKGNVIRTSDVMKDPCFSKAIYIKIIALNTLIIDEDINKFGQRAQILIIAPTWDILGKRKIILDGKNGADYIDATAPNGKGGDGFPGNGEPGLPGLPGSPGGNLFAIGSLFINDQDLAIQLRGGNGGSGQHGGNGTKGIEGKSPPLPESCWNNVKRLWDEAGFDYTSDSTYLGTSIGYNYSVIGKPGTKAGDGGNGGKQGVPGLAGKMLLIELNRTPNLNISRINGYAGAIGKGGFGGGGETQNGKSYVVWITQGQAGNWSPGTCDKEITIIDNGKNEAAKDGIDNYFTDGMLNADPPLDFNHPSIVINEFKSFARERSIGSVRLAEMMNFLNQVTNNGKIRAQYGTLDLIDEFITIENQYFRLRGQIDFIPFLESLLDRIDEFSRTITTTKTRTTALTEHKKVLAYLYTAILSKIYGINKKVNQNTVFDLEKFLDVVESNINALRESITQNNINTIRNDYKSSLKEKVHSANGFIKTQITPEIERIFTKVNEKIDELIAESIKKQTDANEAILEKKRRRRDLENQLRLRKALGPIKLLAAAASFFGPVGAAAGAAIGGGTMLIESLVLDENSAKGIDKVGPLISNDFRNNMFRMTEVFKQKPELIKLKIADLDKYIKEFLAEDGGTPNVSGAEVQAIKEKIKQSKDKMDGLNNQLLERLKTGDIYDIPRDLMRQYEKEEEQLKEYSKDAKEKLEKHKSQLSDNEAEMKLKLEKQLRVISHVQNVVNIGDVSVQLYNQIRNDEAKLQVVGDAIQGLQNDLKILKVHEGKIYNVLIPQVRTIRNTVKEIGQNLTGNSHVELDIKKWNVRSTLSDVRLLFSQMTKDFSVHDSLQLSIQKLDEGMATLIDVYDRIDSYSDSEKLAAYIANIGSRNSDSIQNTELSDAVERLKEMSRSNIVLEEYELAMHGFEQHYFPLAEFFQTTFNLPESLQMNDTSSLIHTSIDQVTKLKNKIKASQSLFNDYDESMHSDVNFDGGVGSQPPFYVWKYHEYKDEIQNLLQGEEITIKADVIYGVNQNAIKFNDIRLDFKLIDGTLQNDLNNELRNFRINMTMVGTNYYRCNNRYYQIPLDRNLAIDFTFEKKADGTPKDRNDIYKKIHENAPFLSPYVMWTIKLTGDYSKLQKFVDLGLDLELIGIGQYLSHGTFTNTICNSQLDKYYSFDRTISNVNSLILSKGA